VDSSSREFWIGKRTLERHSHISSLYLKGNFDFIRCLIPIIDCTSSNLKHLELHVIAALNRYPEDGEQQLLAIPPLRQLESFSINTLPCEAAKFLDFAELPRLRYLMVDHGLAMISRPVRAPSLKREELLEYLLEQIKSSPSVRLRQVLLRSTFIGEVEAKLLFGLSEKIPHKLSLVLKGCEFFQDPILGSLETFADVLVFPR